MSNQSTDAVVVISDWQEAYERTAALAESEPLTLSAPLYRPSSAIPEIEIPYCPVQYCRKCDP